MDEESASPTVQDVERAGIQADHSHMCKFESDTAPGFDLVAEAIQRYADDAPAAVKARWGSEAKERIIQREAAAEQLLPGKANWYIGSSDSLILTSLGSVKGTPHSDSSSTFESSSITTGKEQRALPSPDQQELFEGEYTVEEPEEHTVKVARGNMG